MSVRTETAAQDMSALGAAYSASIAELADAATEPTSERFADAIADYQTRQGDVRAYALGLFHSWMPLNAKNVAWAGRQFGMTGNELSALIEA